MQLEGKAVLLKSSRHVQVINLSGVVRDYVTGDLNSSVISRSIYFSFFKGNSPLVFGLGITVDVLLFLHRPRHVLCLLP